ncbi:MAG: aconitate hydratase AcnA [Desulfuromonadaceae bacterium]|nr:aconitate hydratase AcnA [Desulfuromonadaceae bacterium]MDD5107191.1 aconitate hydratase AcnA [Desulfuromonadaceae bacterium]
MNISAAEKTATSLDSFKCAGNITIAGKSYRLYRLSALEQTGFAEISRLPRTLKILLENLLRNEDGNSVTKADICAFPEWLIHRTSEREIAFRPGRVLMQDFTGVPAVADLAAIRDALARAGGDPESINPLIPVDLVIDHSVQVDSYGSPDSFQINVEREMERNRERYAFLRWGQNSFRNFRVVPPGTGICHQVNLEYLAKVVWQTTQEGSDTVLYPDTLLGTDSHTTMINGLGVLGWGVGGIEAEAAMLGQPVSMTIPDVIGVRFDGHLQPGVTATDLVLTITELLRKTGVVGKFVEFYGAGLDGLTIADRATIANMSPEYGATCGYFPIDAETINYLRLTGRDDVTGLVEMYAKEQGLWRDTDSPDPLFTQSVTVDLSQVVPCLAGPKRPQNRVPLAEVPAAVGRAVPSSVEERISPVNGLGVNLRDGDVVIAAITSCTNTSNPDVMLTAALLAKKALSFGLAVKPWVKTSLAPGSKVVMEYLHRADLSEPLAALGFDLVGYGCTTCIGNSGPLSAAVSSAISSGNLAVSAVLSGNRNFEGRIHPLVKLSWLASPPLVVTFALAGTTRIDLTSEPLGTGKDGTPVYLRDIWPSPEEIREQVAKITPGMFTHGYDDVYDGTAEWQQLESSSSSTYAWAADSSYVKEPPFLHGIRSGSSIELPRKLRILALFGDSITTDHISPAGDIASDSPAGRYLQESGISVADFNSYGSRRGNHEVMMRGTFANIRIRNEMTPDHEGGMTLHLPDGKSMSIFDAAQQYESEGVPLVVIAGKEYGSGSSRDWAAKGPRLLGVRAVIAESFERIHRSNLIGMGILPLQFTGSDTRVSLNLDGSELVELYLPDSGLSVGMTIPVVIHRNNGSSMEIVVKSRLDTANEVAYFNAGGILPFVLEGIVRKTI